MLVGVLLGRVGFIDPEQLEAEAELTEERTEIEIGLRNVRGTTYFGFIGATGMFDLSLETREEIVDELNAMVEKRTCGAGATIGTVAVSSNGDILEVSVDDTYLKPTVEESCRSCN